LGQEAQEGKRGDGFAAAGFADDAEGATGLEGETHAVHRAKQTGVGGKADGEVADFEQGRHGEKAERLKG
jgi:hypothetical protein